MHIGEKMGRKTLVDIWMCLMLIAASVVLYIEALRYPHQTAAYPKMLLVGIAFLSVATLLETLIKTAKNPSSRKTIGEGDWLSLCGVLVFSLVYGIGLRYLGLFFSTIIILPAYMWYLGCRNPKTIIVSYVVFFSFLYSAFIILLGVPLMVFPPFFD